MDYDDNDFQGQNLQLAGEGSSKFSPVLCPYALPKFDFDDNLQGHLRFDSLVENEVFLGIPSQEDNQWIEDFSRGSSVIEFSSSAAESCSISRHNNVWSEATSSESVEMLLKSVGQGEMVPGETIIEESDAGDELGSLTKQMEPNSNQDDIMEDVIDSQTASPPDEFLENSGLHESAEGASSHTRCTSQTQEAEISASTHGTSCEVDPDAVSEKCGLIVTKENLGIDRKCDDSNQREVDTTTNESLNYKIKEDPCVSGIKISNIDSSLQNVTASAGVLNAQEIPHHASDICFENDNGLSKDICKGADEHNVPIQEANMNDQVSTGTAAKTCDYDVDNPDSVSSKVESVKKHAVETGIIKFEETYSLPLKGDFDVQATEACGVDVFSGDPSLAGRCEGVVFSKFTDINEQAEGNAHEKSPVVFQGDDHFEGNAIEVGSTNTGIFAHQEMKLDSPMKITHGQTGFIEEKEGFHARDSQMYRGASASNFELSILSGVDNKAFKQGNESSINHVVDLSSVKVARSSAELLREKPTIDDTNGSNDAPGVQKEDSNVEDHVLPPILAGSKQIYKEIVFFEQSDVHNCVQVVSVHESGNAKLPTDSSVMECEVVGSSSSGEVMKENIVIAHGLEFDTTTANKPSLDVAVGDTNLASCDTYDGVSSISGSGATTTDGVIDCNEEQKSPVLGVGLNHPDEKEEMEIDIPSDTGLSSKKGSSQVTSEVGPVSEVERGASCDSAVQKLHETVGPSVSINETCYASNQSEPTAVTNEVDQECSEKLEVRPVFCDSAIKEGDRVDAVAFEDHKETTVQRNHEVASLEVAVDTSNNHQASFDLVGSSECDANSMLEGGDNSPDSDKANCDSPTVISCIELSRSDGDKEEELKGVVDNVPLPEATGLVDGKVQSISVHLRGNDNSKEDRNFTFEVSPLVGLSEGEIGKSWQSFPSIQACKMSTIVEGYPSTSGGNQRDAKTVQGISHRSPQASDGGVPHGGAKGAPGHKMRRGSGKTARKEHAKKGNHVKETTPARQFVRGDKSRASISPLGTGQHVQFEELKLYGNVERAGAKPCGVISIPTSNLPDLNTSVPLSAVFQHPFTDIQQVQLGAQIFVYGSLIQGAAPDESYMVSAFGQSDGARNVWEPAWRACLERLHGQKSHANNSGSPAQSRLGTRTPDQAIKHGPLQSKVLSSPVGRASSKGTPSPVVNPMIPLSSPLWNVSTPSCDGLQSGGIPRSQLLGYHQTLSPLHPYQNLPMQNFVGHNPSWRSQASFPGPWVASPQTSSSDISARFSGFPITEAVKLTPVKESSIPISSSTKHVSPIPVAHSGGPDVFASASPVDVKKVTVSTGQPATKHVSPIPVAHSGGPNVFAGASPVDVKKVTVSTGHHSADPKARKRKRVPVIEDLSQISSPPMTRIELVSDPVSSHLVKKVDVTKDLGEVSLLAQSRTELVPVPASHFSTSVAVTTATCFAAQSNSGKFLSALAPTCSSDHPKRGDQIVENKVIISKETCSKVEEAKLEADAAATQAAAVVNHCQDVWSQLDKQKKSGLVSDVEAKLASSAAAIAAAASVAKAAAAAAKIASNAAVQAKLMADEALILSETGNPTPSMTISLPNVVNNLGKPTPVTILKAGDRSNCSSSIIVAAREAARRRVEAAAAASKHAEILDAIVKAAELTAEAVSQAGKIVAMGDPLPLNELVEFGPEGYWKEQGVKSNNVNRDQSNTNSFEDIPYVSAKQSDGGLSDMEMHNANHGISPLPREISMHLMEDHTRRVDSISGSVTGNENDSRGQKGRRVSELDKPVCIDPELELDLRSTSVTAQDENENATGSSKENIITEGSLVEVFKDDGNCKAAWFYAEVSSLMDGKAFVCYTELQSDEGSEKLKEWVPLEDKGNKAPRIRIAHPMTTMQFEGKKRRRSAMTDYAWSIGDRVDAWIQNCWHLGVVTEKKNETTLTVHFPVEGETSIVRAWDLRPTLVWKEGAWIEWSSSRGVRSSQGDAPQEKRLKLGSPVIEGKGKDKMSKNISLVESGKHEESRLLPLSANDKIFNVGKNTIGENKLDALGAMSSGLQKQGSGVIFGVPKPGKKTKFMEVSKHYVSDRSSKNNSANDSVKFARYLMPQGSQGWKNRCKFDAKEKQAAESKPKVSKSGKPQIVSGGTLPPRNNLLTSTDSVPNDATITDRIVKDSVTNAKNESGLQKSMEFGFSSNAEEAAEGPTLFSSLALPPDASNKMPSSIAKSERPNKGKVALAGGKSTKVEVMDKSDPEVVEPRRSNRRIQPTSRLLEGLQSSLTVSKLPAVSLDKSHRSQDRGTPKAGNNHHG